MKRSPGDLLSMGRNLRPKSVDVNKVADGFVGRSTLVDQTYRKGAGAVGRSRTQEQARSETK